ncbi:MAG: hypothetical protein Q7S76_00730, partial [bacterium]|nr:hypothetical protein [bacterium]
MIPDFLFSRGFDTLKSMKAARIGVIFILFIFAFGINIPHTVYAQSCAITANNQPLTTPIASGIDVTFSADVTPFNRAGGYYWFKFQCFGWNDPDSGNKTPLGNKVSHQLSSTSCALNPSDQSRYVELHWKPSSTGTSQLLCTNYYQVPSAATSGVCSIRIDPPNPSITDTVYADVDIFTDDVLDLKVNGKGAAKNQTVATLKGKNNRVKLNTGSYAQGFGEGNYTVSLEGRTLNFNRCETDFFVSTQGGQVSSIEPTNICVFSND